MHTSSLHANNRFRPLLVLSLINKSKKSIIVRAIYGLKSAYQAFFKHLADCMHSLTYKSYIAYPDLCLYP
ncbi:LOW QUALITY PROTEIN: hypothetical protein ACHAXS_001032 [Conticribra weissflogii]